MRALSHAYSHAASEAHGIDLAPMLNRATNSKGGVLIVADEHAPTGAVVAVVDEVHLGGIANITFTTQSATR